MQFRIDIALTKNPLAMEENLVFSVDSTVQSSSSHRIEFHDLYRFKHYKVTSACAYPMKRELTEELMHAWAPCEK